LGKGRCKREKRETVRWAGLSKRGVRGPKELAYRSGVRSVGSRMRGRGLKISEGGGFSIGGQRNATMKRIVKKMRGVGKREGLFSFICILSL